MGPLRQRKNSVFHNIIEQQYDQSIKYKLYNSVKGSKDWVQRLGLLKTLPIHSGCVNCICWNDKGDRLLSGSDDQHLVISHAYNYKVLTNYKTSHRANIFSAKFLPHSGDTTIVSCSGDGMILHTDLLRPEATHHNLFNCHVGTTYEVATIPDDPNTFLSCGEDCTVRCFDLRVKQKCTQMRCAEDVMISCQRAVTALTVNNVLPYQLAIGCSDSTVRLYDRRMLRIGFGDSTKPYESYTAPGMEGRSYRITSLSFSPKGEEILVSYSSEHIYLFGLRYKKTTTFSTDAEVQPAETSGSQESTEPSSPVAPVRRLRLRGDWSDTGPDARPQNETVSGGASHARPTLHGTLMQRMTDVLSRMLNDPATRAALSQGGEDTFAESAEEGQSSHSEPNPQENQDAPPTPATLPEQHQAIVDLDIDELMPGECPCRAGGEASGSDEPQSGDHSSPLDLPLPSFSSSFSSPPAEQIDQEPSVNVDSMEEPNVEEGNIEEPVAEPMPETQEASNNKLPSTSSNSFEESKKPHSTQLNELSSMCHGFVEKHGVEPMVNLTYSDVGPTASSISVTMGDGDAPRPSAISEQKSSPSPAHVNSQSTSTRSPLVQEVATEGRDTHSMEGDLNDDDFVESDDDLIECQIIHPIEKHMDEAINNARGESSSEPEDTINKTKKQYFKQKYTGHRNARTMIKEATFWGDEYVISGSDCGHVFMWERESATLRMLLQADHHVVNCVQPHPYLPVLATSGIDYDVKLWAPVQQLPAFDSELAEELMKRNAIMLEETKDTITVPASFMIRMLACLNQIRRGGRRQHRRESNANSD
ncbi:DDB1- and CUL4-associated factor 6-like isoform X2 [Rhodnius prolixus]